MTVYAINKRTKEHRVIDEGRVPPYINARRWQVWRSDADGWIQWSGGECPLPKGHLCDVAYRDGEIGRSLKALHISGKSREASVCFWNHDGQKNDIIAYRPILDADDEPEAPEWDGEGLPPVGCECEGIGEDGGWQHCRVVGQEGGQLWLYLWDDGYVTRHLDDAALRPTRTAEDRAVEEMEAIVGCSASAWALHELYRAGYRRE